VRFGDEVSQPICHELVTQVMHRLALWILRVVQSNLSSAVEYLQMQRQLWAEHGIFQEKDPQRR
jgi:hypothetical protein